MDVLVGGKNLYFTYNKGKTNEYQALKNISFDIYEKEFVIIFGPSGCGKSSLLNVIAGLELPDEGSINVMGRDLTNLKKNEFAIFHRNEIGMVYQQYNLITSLTVLANVTLPQIFVNVGKRKREKWGESLLKRFGILEHASKIPTELSGGQQQRIGIARAIVNNPKIILADEPVGNLDSISAENVLDILCELNENEGKTIILVTHNPEYLYVADRIIYMKDGVITKEVINRDKNKKKKIDTESLKTKSPTATISDLMRSYRGLSPEQINILIMPYKAKIFTHHFITSRSMEETNTFENVVQRRLLGAISEGEFIDVLNRPSREGGVGFDIRTAERVARRIGRVIRMAYLIYQDKRQKKDENGKHATITDDEKTDKVLKYLLETCYHDYSSNLSDTQIERLRTAVYNRLTSSIQKIQFYDYADRPFQDGGVGLNSKTAKAITEEIELILVLGFGIVQTKKTPKLKMPDSPRSDPDKNDNGQGEIVADNDSKEQGQEAENKQSNKDVQDSSSEGGSENEKHIREKDEIDYSKPYENKDRGHSDESLIREEKVASTPTIANIPLADNIDKAELEAVTEEIKDKIMNIPKTGI